MQITEYEGGVMFLHNQTGDGLGFDFETNKNKTAGI